MGLWCLALRIAGTPTLAIDRSTVFRASDRWSIDDGSGLARALGMARARSRKSCAAMDALSGCNQV